MNEPQIAGASEQVFFSEQGIQITNARAVFPNTTYAMANITSVCEAVDLPNRTWPVVVILLGLLLLAGKAVLGLLAVSAGIFWWTRQKKIYYVKIGSASGEAQPLKSTDFGWIHRVVQAMNEAFIKRG